MYCDKKIDLSEPTNPIKLDEMKTESDSIADEPIFDSSSDSESDDSISKNRYMIYSLNCDNTKSIFTQLDPCKYLEYVSKISNGKEYIVCLQGLSKKNVSQLKKLYKNISSWELYGIHHQMQPGDGHIKYNREYLDKYIAIIWSDGFVLNKQYKPDYIKVMGRRASDWLEFDSIFGKIIVCNISLPSNAKMELKQKVKKILQYIDGDIKYFAKYNYKVIVCGTFNAEPWMLKSINSFACDISHINEKVHTKIYTSPEMTISFLRVDYALFYGFESKSIKEYVSVTEPLHHSMVCYDII